MEFRDITNDHETHYRLGANEEVVFFLHNRGGDLTIELSESGATAYVFAFFTKSGEGETTLRVHQQHLAPRTNSRVVVKSVLWDRAQFAYRGTLHIAENATLSDASQENRNLILSRGARAFSEPILEILTSDVRCHHAASTSPLNPETLFALTARGLTPDQAKHLLIRGFFQSSIETLETLLSPTDQQKVLSLMKNMLIP